jgi:hypothetical protein
VVVSEGDVDYIFGSHFTVQWQPFQVRIVTVEQDVEIVCFAHF